MGRNFEGKFNAHGKRIAIVASRFNEHPKLSPLDRVILVVIASLTRTWRSAVLIVKPETVLRWHRAGFRLIWRRKSRPRGRPPLQPELVALIRHVGRGINLVFAQRPPFANPCQHRVERCPFVLGTAVGRQQLRGHAQAFSR